jgi:selenocysteine-specific elongation factor
LDCEVLEKGKQGYAQLRLEEAVAVKSGDHFILRFYSPVETIAGGVILDANPIKHKRFLTDTLKALEVKESGNFRGILEQLIKEGSRSLLSYQDLAAKSGRTIRELTAYKDELIKEKRVVDLTEDLGVHIDFFELVREAGTGILKEYHHLNPVSRGMAKAEFRKRLSDKIRIRDGRGIDLLIQELMKEGLIKDCDGTIALASFHIEYRQEHLEMQDRLEKRYLDYGYEVPELDEVIAGEKDKKLARQMAEALSADGKLKKLTYQVFLHRSYWDSALASLLKHMEAKGSITLAEYRDLLGTSRKYAVMILESMDEQKITRLEGDSRILR